MADAEGKDEEVAEQTAEEEEVTDTEAKTEQVAEKTAEEEEVADTKVKEEEVADTEVKEEEVAEGIKVEAYGINREELIKKQAEEETKGIVNGRINGGRRSGWL